MDKPDIIEKRKYMGDRSLVNMVIPQGVTAIEDWGFANCKNLKEIHIPASVTRISAKAFTGCDKLSRIYVYGDMENDNPILLAMAVREWNKHTEEFIRAAVSEEFYILFDELLSEYLDTPDDEGFSPFLAGGEEDYTGAENDVDAYCNTVRKRKAALIYERLFSEKAGHKISADKRERFISFLKLNSDGAAFDILCENFSGIENVTEYRRLYFEMQIPDRDILFLLMEKVKSNAELRAMLIEYSQSGDDGFMRSLTL